MLGSINAGGTVIRHSEYIADIVSPGTNGFIAQQPFVLNIGNSQSFPWGATIGGLFEQFKFKRVVYEYRTLCTEVATGANPAMGAVIMGTKYDSLDPGFSSKIEMENYEYTQSCKPSCSMFHAVNCKAITGGKLFVRDSSIFNSNRGDLRLYDLGNFTIATNNLQADAGVALGELWVHYEVVLYKPVLIANNAVAFDQFTSTTVVTADKFKNAASNGRNTLGGGIGGTQLTSNTAFISDVAQNPAISILGANDGVPGNYYLFPPNISTGKYLVCISWSGAAATPGLHVVKPFTTQKVGGAAGFSKYAPTFVPTWKNFDASTNFQIEYTAALANQTGSGIQFVLDINGPNAGFSVSADTVITGTNMKMLIVSLPETFTV